MATYTNPIIAAQMQGDKFIRRGGIAQGASVVCLQTEYNLAHGNDGSRAANDVDEIFVLRRGHRLVEFALFGVYQTAGDDANKYKRIISDAVGAFKAGLLDGAIGSDVSANNARSVINGVTIAAAQDVAYKDSEAVKPQVLINDGRYLGSVTDNEDRAIGIKWDAAAVKANAPIIHAVMRIEVQPHNGVA